MSYSHANGRTGVRGTPVKRTDLSDNRASKVKKYTLPPEELAAIHEKYGPPVPKGAKKPKRPIEIKTSAGRDTRKKA